MLMVEKKILQNNKGLTIIREIYVYFVIKISNQMKISNIYFNKAYSI